MHSGIWQNLNTHLHEYLAIHVLNALFPSFTIFCTLEGDEQVWEAGKSEGAREPERKRLKLGIETPVAAKGIFEQLV